MTTNKGNEKIRKRDPLRNLKDLGRRATAWLLCFSMVAGNLPGSLIVAGAETYENTVEEEEAPVEIYSMTLDSLCDAAEDAIRYQDPMTGEEYLFAGDDADLFDAENGLIFEVYPKVEGEDSLTLKTFIKIGKDELEEYSEIFEEDEETGEEDEEAEENSGTLSRPVEKGSTEAEEEVSDEETDEWKEEEEEDGEEGFGYEYPDLSYYNVTGNEEVIFLLINNTEEDVAARVRVVASSIDDEEEEEAEGYIEYEEDDESGEEKDEDRDDDDEEITYETSLIIVPGNSSDETESPIIIIDSDPNEGNLEYIVVDEKEENVEAAALSAETASNAEKEYSSRSSIVKRAITENVESGSNVAGSVIADAVPESASNANSQDDENTKRMKGKWYTSLTVDGDKAAAFVTTFADLGADYGIMMLVSGQIINGSGSIGVWTYENVAENESSYSYTLKVEDVPTYTAISLSSPKVTLTPGSGTDDDEDIPAIEGNLYYVSNADRGNLADAEAIKEYGSLVTSLILGDSAEEETEYTLVPYGENGSFDMSNGILMLYISGGMDEDGTKIWLIQTNTLCYLDDSENYQQMIIEAAASFNPLIADIDSYNEGDAVELENLFKDDLNEPKYTEFYYGNIYSTPIDLTKCTKGKIVNGELLPLDESGNPVYDVSIYAVYDNLYSFDVDVYNVVNEHTEDNGDTYLWLGNTFYIDQYHAQGTDGGGSTGYTQSQGYDWVYPEATNSQGVVFTENAWQGSGVWVQLGRVRERAMNEGIYVDKNGSSSKGSKTSFDDYKDVSYNDMLDVVDMTGYDSSKAANTAEGNAPYGIVGPFRFTNGETEQKKTTVRITGHLGDEFTQTEIFDNDVVYMITEDKELNTNWINLGDHASDRGYRAWFYWINEYYVVNNHQDELEFVEIYENEDNGEIHLLADEIGSEGTGEGFDIWDITGLYTRRNSVVKDYMLDNKATLEEENIGFSDLAGYMDHIQLRTNTTVETVINDAVYNGTFQILYQEDTPYVTYKIKKEATSLNDDPDFTGEYIEGESVLTKSNDQETNSLYFESDSGVSFYVLPEYAENPDFVEITVTVRATGDLTHKDANGDVIDKISYTTDEPLVYQTTLTAEQLAEAVDDCPNNQGYDVAINLADAVKTDNETSITLYKIWDDDNNSQGSRDYVTYVTVSLERSTDGETWETVEDENGPKAFIIRGDKNSVYWYLDLDSSDLDLTYEDAAGERRDYYFRIAEEQDIVGVTDGFEYTYTIGEFSTDENENESLMIMNSLGYTIDISGVKNWVDDKENEITGSNLPESVIVAVYKDGEYYDRTEAKAESSWKFEFNDLPQAVSGGEEVYTYTIAELNADGTRKNTGDYNLLDDDHIYKVTIEKVSADPDSETEDPGEAYDYEITNQRVDGSLTITKHVVESESDEESEGGNTSHKDASYTVVITAEELLDSDINWGDWKEYITVSDETGDEISSKSELTINTSGDKVTITFTIKDDETLTVNHLPAGSYTVSETSENSDFVPVYHYNGNESVSAPTVTVTTDDNNKVSVEIENVYDIGTHIEVQKTYSSEYPAGESAFTFTITPLKFEPEAEGDSLEADEMPMPQKESGGDNNSVTITDRNAVSFGEMTFSHPGTYYYKITETKGNLEYVTYDSTMYYVKIVVSYDEETYVETAEEFYAKVTDNDASVDDENEGYKELTYIPADSGIVIAEFENGYKAEGGITLTATKEYEGAELTEGLFNFTITETTEGIGEEALYSGTGMNEDDGNITFEPEITYTKDNTIEDIKDDTGTHTYLIAEKNESAGGVTYDSNTITVTVEVTDNGDGTLSTTVKVGENEIIAGDDGSYNVGTFTNTYAASGSVQLGVTKTITGRESTNTTFTFDLYKTDENFEEGTLLASASTTNTLSENEKQSVVFKSDDGSNLITFDGGGSYYYVIKETTENASGWSIDGTEYHVTVNTTDDGEGHITVTGVTYSYIDSEETTQSGTLTANSDGVYGITGESILGFTNTYGEGEGMSTSVIFGGTKNIIGESETENTFTFNLYVTDSSYDIKGKATIDTKQLDEITSSTGTFQFNKIEYNYSEERENEHGFDRYYVITESVGANGWIYDSTEYHIHVVVSDDDTEGSLSVKVYLEKDGEDKELTASNDGVYGLGSDGIVFTNLMPKMSKAVAEDDYKRKTTDGTEMHDGENIDDEGWGTWNDADNNQEVSFRLKLENIAGATNLTVHDYLGEGLELVFDEGNAPAITVTLYDGDNNEGKPFTNNADYTVTAVESCTDSNNNDMGGCTFEISFQDSVFEDLSSNAYIVIAYTAITNTSADDYKNYENEIKNQSYMTYGDSSRTEIVMTTTALFSFDVYKYASDGETETALAGAEFVLMRDEEYATFTTETGSDGETYYLVSEWSDAQTDDSILTSGENGMIHILGLDDDTYTLIETKAPEGYVLFDIKITVVIDEEGIATFTGSGAERDDSENTHKVSVRNSASSNKDVDVPGEDEKSPTYGDDGESVKVGDTVTYKIEYQNGPDVATITITDVLDFGLDFKEASDYGVYDEETRTITWTIENVEAYDTGSVTFTATVNENAVIGNEVDNTAKVVIENESGTKIEIETNTTENPVPDKDVDADGDGEYGDSGLQVQVGDTLTYKISYQNTDDDPATVTITDVLDEGLDFVSASYDGSYDEDTRTITWVLEDVAPHSEENNYVTFTATVNENALVKNEVDNTATVQVGEHDAQQTRTVYNPVPAKGVSVGEDGASDEEYNDSGEEVSVGDTLIYKIDYRNDYEDPATITITDVLDTGLDFVSASDSGTYDEGTRTITWVVEGVEAHTGGRVTFTATVNEAALIYDEVSNTAKVQVGDDTDNTIETNPVYNPVPSKDVDIDPADGYEYGDSGRKVKLGDTLTYKIEYRNDYDRAVIVTITDTLDKGLTYVDWSASDGGTYDEETRTITWVLNDVQPSHKENDEGHEYAESQYVTFEAVVNGNALVLDYVENTASVQIDNEEAVDTNKVWNPLEPGKGVDTDGDESYDNDGEDVKVGDTLTYIISYFNESDSDVATVTITDVLDDGLTYGSSNPEAEVTTDAEGHTILTWIIGDVDPLTGGSVTFTAIVNGTALTKDEVTNKASVHVGDDPSATYETNETENPVPGKDVDTDEDDKYGDSGESVEVGQTLTYIIEYYNGHSQAAVVTITDVLDTGLDYVEGSAGENATYGEATHTITWVIENVEAGYSGSVTFKATVNETALVRNEVDNTATVQVGNDPAVNTNTVYNPVPDKDVDADEDGEYGDSGLQVQVGDELTYIIYYQNSDDEAATVTITDVLDEGLDFVSATYGGTYDDETRTITWVLEDVAPHSEEGYYVTFTAIVNETALVKNEVDNTATVQVGEHAAQQTRTVYNPIPGKDVDVPEDDESDEEKFSDSGVSVQVGDTLTYKIEYRNDNDGPATVTITDTLDEGLTYVEGSAGENATYDEATRTITWVLENVQPSHDVNNETGEEYGTYYVTFEAVVNESALTRNEISNKATVEIGDNSVDTNTVYNPVSHKDVDVPEEGETDEGKFDDDGVSAKVGDILTYKIDYENPNDDPATVTITDTLDEGLTYVEGSAGENATYDEATRTITWVIENVEPHTNGSVTFKAEVNDKALRERKVENTAEVVVGEHSSVTNTVENPVYGKDVDVDPDDGLDYGDNGVGVKVGDTLTYEIVYQNTGEETVTVAITDRLDEGLTYVESSASDGGTYDDEARTITWFIENVSGGSSGSVTFQATVNSNALVINAVENTADIKIGDNEYQTNTTRNPLRQYFPIDEEIVPDHNDRDTWVKDESVNEYNAIEIEMSTNLPVIEANDLANGNFTMNFHELLDSELSLDNFDADFSVYIAGTQIDHTYYTVTLASGPATLSVRALSDDTAITDGCTFHVDVDLTALYNDGIVTDDMLDGNTEIMIFFFADLEGTGLNGSYKSTVWYDVYDGDKWEYTSNVDVVEVYTYEIDVIKYDTSTLEGDDYDSSALAGATLGVYYDEGCEEPVYRYSYTGHRMTDENSEKTAYTVISGDDGYAIFYGLAEGTYYVKETIAPSGYELGGTVLTITLGGDAGSATYGYPNSPEPDEPEPHSDEPGSGKDVDVDPDDDHEYGDDGVTVHVGDTLTYKIDYENSDDAPVLVTITDVLDEGLDFVSASDDGIYDESTRTITWTLNDVAARTFGSVTFKATVNWNALIKNEVDNTATVKEGNHSEQRTNKVENPVESKGVDTDGDGSYGDNGVSVRVGDTLEYSIYYENPDDEAADIVITDTLDDGLTYISSEPAAEVSKDEEGHTVLTWTIENVAANTYGSVTFKAEVNGNALVQDSDGAASVDNTGEVKIGEHESKQTNTVHNPVESKSVDADGDGVFDDNGSSVKYGDNLVYEIYYKNTDEDAVTVTITDTLDAGLTFVSATDGGTYDSSSRTVTWTIEGVPAGGSGSVKVTARVNTTGRSTGSVSNTGSVQVGDNPATKTNTVTNNVPGTNTSTSSGGGGYSGSGGGGSSSGGPGAENTAHESSGGGDSSGNSIGTDSIGGLPQTGEGNGMFYLFGACIVLAVLLVVLFYMRRRTPNDQK